MLFLFSGSVAASILLLWDSAGEKDDQPYRVMNPLFLDWEFLYLHLEKKKQHVRVGTVLFESCWKVRNESE